MIKYPIGIHTFEGIRRQGFVYVDKTELIYRLKHRGRHYLLCRPRLFGKSLLLSTIQSYFKGEKELFQGLMIADLEKSWHRHAVLKFDFQYPLNPQEADKAKDEDAQDAQDALDHIIDSQLRELEQLYGRNKREISIKDRFLGLIERAYQNSQRGVVILIDNYDSPLLATMGQSAVQSHYIQVLTQFYSALPLALDKIRFSLICGITAIGKSSFLKDYVYSSGIVGRSCNLKSHYKNANTLTSEPVTQERVEMTPSQGSNPDESAFQTGNPYSEKESDSPVECPIIQELPPACSASDTVLALPESEDTPTSGAELVNDDNSITATNEDSRFSATASEDFIPMDADPTVKVIIDPSDSDKQQEAISSNTQGKEVNCLVEGEDTPKMGRAQNASEPVMESEEKPRVIKTDQNSIDNVINSSSANCDVSSVNLDLPNNSLEGAAFIRDISLDGAFTGLCGFSEDEILENMHQGLERLAEYKESDLQSVMEAFSRRYYGYHFNINGKGKFNPYDVFNALSQDRLGDYWCSVMRASGIKDLVISKIMSRDFDMRLLKECKIPRSELEQDPFLSDSPIPLLYQCGYLTIMGHGPKDKMYYLALANKEVREEFLSELLDCYGCFRPQRNNYITAMLEDLQNGYPEIFVVRMKSFFQDPDDAGYCSYYPQSTALKMTNFQLYCQNILYLVFTLLSKDVLESFGQEIGYEINDGNAELLMQLDHSIYIFEFVLDQDINYALHLLQQRHLQAPVIYEGKHIVKVCVCISSELHNIDSWFVEKDDSPQYQSDGDEASAFPLFSPHNL